MIAKIIAHGATREQAIARLRRAVADTMVALDEGTTNQGFLLELLGRPERTAARSTRAGSTACRPRATSAVRHADAALVQAAIALSDAATADERAHFYALARRAPGRRRRCLPDRRPHASAASATASPSADRAAPLPRRGRRRPHRGDRGAADRARLAYGGQAYRT